MKRSRVKWFNQLVKERFKHTPGLWLGHDRWYQANEIIKYLLRRGRTTAEHP